MQYDLTRNVPSTFKERYDEILPEIKDLSEQELETHFKPKLELYQIKNNLWKEIEEKHLDPNKKVTLSSISLNICTLTTLTKYINNPYILAWFMTPMANYDIASKAVLAKAVKRYDDLINMDITTVRRYKDSDGEVQTVTIVDSKKAEVLLKTIQNIENRVLGTAVQKNINLTSDLDKVNDDVKIEFDMDKVNDRIKELEEKLDAKAQFDDTIDIKAKNSAN